MNRLIVWKRATIVNDYPDTCNACQCPMIPNRYSYVYDNLNMPNRAEPAVYCKLCLFVYLKTFLKPHIIGIYTSSQTLME